MVSINRNFSTAAGGGVFFNDNSVSDDDTQQLQPVVGDVGRKFMPLATVVAVTLQLLFCIGMAVAGVVLCFVWPEELDKCEPFFIILYIHAGFWCISMIVDRHIQDKHHELRINGYLEFYRELRNHSKMPFYIASLWNTILLVISTAYHYLYDDFKKQCMGSGFKRPIYHLSFAVVLETVILIVIIVFYVKKVMQFNRSRPPPDVLREEWMINFIQDSYSGGEIGYRERGDHIHDLLEKQADLIRYLIDRNTKLSQKIMMLSARVNGEHA